LPYTETQIISNGSVNKAIWLDDDSLALATSIGLYLHDLTSGRSQILDARFSMSSVAFIPDDDLIAAGGQDSVIRIWDIYDGSFVTRLNGHLLGVVRLAYSQTGDFLASASDDATVRIWDYESNPLYTFRDSVTRVADMAVSLNGQMVASASNRHVHIRSPLNGDLLKTISQPIGWYTAVAFNPNSQVLSTAFDGRRLEFWETATWNRTDFISLDTEVLSLTYSPNGRLLAIGFEDGNIQILDAASLYLLADFAGHTDLTSMVFNATSDQLLTSSSDGSIRIWDVSPVLNP
jgi:WD40 repeat protein